MHYQLPRVRSVYCTHLGGQWRSFFSLQITRCIIADRDLQWGSKHATLSAATGGHLPFCVLVPNVIHAPAQHMHGHHLVAVAAAMAAIRP